MFFPVQMLCRSRVCLRHAPRPCQAAETIRVGAGLAPPGGGAAETGRGGPRPYKEFLPPIIPRRPVQHAPLPPCAWRVSCILMRVRFLSDRTQDWRMAHTGNLGDLKIGSASCRERVCQYV